jgi:hypothetical protein
MHKEWIFTSQSQQHSRPFLRPPPQIFDTRLRSIGKCWVRDAPWSRKVYSIGPSAMAVFAGIFGLQFPRAVPAAPARPGYTPWLAPRHRSKKISRLRTQARRPALHSRNKGKRNHSRLAPRSESYKKKEKIMKNEWRCLCVNILICASVSWRLSGCGGSRRRRRSSKCGTIRARTSLFTPPR